ncbi:cyclic nucleotide-binding domain-containing protein [Streptomyces erythrochromogenes]|uniref:Cyclic nucleotide-binding domain-containing protein n=1 Tax=Streptomyces erythrochromogenes TaxID=285574 RepID=A0ABZ1QKC8_9ACTN|nr:cyclic nucleotide-binding domain-containing protein [Streptomyces erythrochromogenes]
MSTHSPTRVSEALPADCRSRLVELAQEVNFDEGTHLFREGGHADRFWIVRSGTVTLDVHVPGRRAAVIESLGAGQLVGCRPPAGALSICTRPTAAAASSDRPHGEGAGHARIPLHRQ